ncbi:uncharacterized protein LOC105198127 [Solenopsis invicta]|uniref:uncharacterized protein LOC105198127 n=1 Tax=Solenopsis invicta TaxID=13686 RepID=UPI000595FA86|nr:uncharacterized protein LOC105198127 [Solenopsis invicta]
MAFGLTQWLISFAIFLTILTIITWSAVHLGKKDQSFIDANLRLFNVDDYSIEGKKRDKSLYPTNVHNSMLRVTEKTDSLTLFANEQGSEIPDSEEFYKILQSFYSTKSSVFNKSNYDTATFASSVIKNDSKRNYDITVTLSNTSDKTFVLNDRQHNNEKITILPNNISQTTHSTHLTYKIKLFDNTNRSREIDLNQSARTEVTEFHQND